uniref:Related to cleavage and polyadenylation specificity factor, 160 kDa subunit n=1 Tax=Melanopsichium pennsylvanicum 4 TaxID=1398559 RepID=A0A077RD04_9BASI|nr:related to cleavage and polyadenylation specificity factor, 160 kDa subunit [Melanopsichium pennsylvanicum 4]
MASGYHYQELAPGGCSLAVFLKLHYHSPIPSESQQLYLHRGQLQTQLVTARDDLLTIYDVYERPTSSLSAHTSTSSITNSSTSHKLVISRKHNLFGIVTGLQRIQTLSSDTDHRDRLLVSFADAKIALLEWNDATDDLETVSIHTYERAPQLLNGTPHLFQPNLSVDPLSRCAALLLPHDALAILPFYRDAAEFDLDKDFHLDNLAQDDAAAVAAAKDMESLPYSPSFVLTMPEVDAKIRNLKDFCFLPGFQKPTVAVLFQYSPTWTGLLAERKDTYSVFLFTLDLSASLDGMTLDNNNGTTRSLHPVVTTSSPLPLDCLYMIPCPQTLGGVLVVCMSSILHVDQSGRVVVTALNSWFKSVSSIEPESVLELQGLDDLQGSQIVFTSETEGLLTLVSGDLYRVVCQMDGRSVEGMRLERMNESFSASEELKAATGSPSSCLAIAPQNNHSSANGGSLAYLFNASTAGDSTLYNLVPVRKPLTSSQEEDASAKPEPTSTAHDMDLDLDDDLYGTSDALTTNNAKTNGSSKHETILTVRKVDTVRSHGGLHSVARRKLTEEESGSFKRHELVAACGSGNQAGIVYLDPRFVPQHRTVLVSEAGTETPSFSKVFTLNKESNGRIRMIGSRSNEDLSMAFTAPGEVSTVPSQKQGTWTDSVELSGATLCAGLLLGGDCVARITSNSVQVLSLDTTEVVHETKLESRIQHASLDASQYAVIHTWDSETLIFNFDASKREFETVDTSAILTGPIISANIFRDTFHNLSPALGSKFKEAVVESGADAAAAQSRAIFGSYSNDDEEQIDYGEDDDDQSMVAPTNGNHINGSNTTTAAVEAAPAYVFTLDLDSTARIFSLPNLELVWQNFSVAAQPQRLRYESQGHTELAPEQVATISTAVACHLGDMICLVSVTSDNFLTVYKANAFGHADEKLKTAGEGMQALTFNKLFVQLLAVPAARAFDSSANGFKTGAVQLEPFSVGSAEGMVASSNALTVLGGGKESSASVLCWTAEGGHKVLDWPQGDLVCLGAIPTGSMQSECCSWTGAADYAYVDRSGTLFMGQLPPGLDSTSSWSSRIVRTGRSYTRITTHNPTHCVVAASILPHQFVLFDEDGEAIASHGSEDATTVSYRGALELFIGQDRSTPVDGYEFEQNETVTSLEVVTLDAPSTTSGCKQFIAAGTTTYHGEDRTCKGSVYLFEIISVVSSAKDEIGNDFRLKLITRDDSRAPVTAICELNGFLVHTSGQKLYGC